MKMFRRTAIFALALVGIATAAWAIQPGTSGTNKQGQASGLRVGVLECLNRTATASAGAATISGIGTTQPSACGTVTSESLTTAAGSEYTLTLTNNLIAATDMVFAAVSNGTNTGGELYVTRITPAASSVAIVVKNDAAGPVGTGSALNGTIKINFLVIKLSAADSD